MALLLLPTEGEPSEIFFAAIFVACRSDMLVKTLIALALGSIAALAGIFYVSGITREASTRAEATRLISEGQQLASMASLRIVERGGLPSRSDIDPVDQLVAEGYVKAAPPGANLRTGAPSGWRIDFGRSAVMSTVGPSASPAARQVCTDARRALRLSHPDTIYLCSGADSPGGLLGDREPCCIES